MPIYIWSGYVTAKCEECVERHSEGGDMEKYHLVVQSGSGILYVIYTSDPIP